MCEEIRATGIRLVRMLEEAAPADVVRLSEKVGLFERLNAVIKDASSAVQLQVQAEDTASKGACVLVLTEKVSVQHMKSNTGYKCRWRSTLSTLNVLKEACISEAAMHRIADMVMQGVDNPPQHIEAIKIFRQATGVSLRDAKDFVDCLIVVWAGSIL